MIPYLKPTNWIAYNEVAIMTALTRAKAAVMTLQNMPYQRRWVERLQSLELKREVAGTSRIEGAEFTERELDSAMRLEESAAALHTRSQRQARAALKAYEWIKGIPDASPVTAETILHIHRLMVTNADDDHCPPGVLRGADQNVNFGSPKHRGVEGGEDCRLQFAAFVDAIDVEFQAHDPLVRAIAAHYHFASMHPFLDGNGRTARALEALLLGRAGLRNTSFIAMSNYYHDEKPAYLTALAEVRKRSHDLTPFLVFALRGVEIQAQRLLSEIQKEIKRELFVNLMMDLFYRLQTPRKRVIADRQVAILHHLLSVETMPLHQMLTMFRPYYLGLKNPDDAQVRDLNALITLGTISIQVTEKSSDVLFVINWDWPAEITETEFFQKIKKMPKSRASWSK